MVELGLELETYAFGDSELQLFAFYQQYQAL